MTRNLGLYAAFARQPWPRSYLGKLLLIAFVGTHVPLICLVLFVVLMSGSPVSDHLFGLGVLTLVTLVSTGFTLAAITGLLAPVATASKALTEYLQSGKVPDLPQRYDDLAGRLMRDVSYTLGRLDDRLRELELIATTDPLTGVYNRRAGNLALAESLARAERTGTPFYLVLLDVNEFKLINDRFGHAIGDQCLRRLAERVRAGLRATDWIVRWGGDEFVIGIAAGAEEVGAIEARVRKSLEGLTVRPEGKAEVAVGVSMGLAAAGRGDQAADLYRRADEALYRAKEELGGHAASASERTTAASRLSRAIPAMALMLALVGAPGTACAAERLAMFDIDLVNTSLEATRPDELERLRDLNEQARAAFAARGYEIVDTAPVADAAFGQTMRDCNGCELGLAQRIGADVVVIGWIQKVSNLIINLNVQMRDVASGRLLRAGSVDMRGNTSESWRRTLVYLMERRLFPQGT